MPGLPTFGLDALDEAFYARDVDGFLIRVDPATHDQMHDPVELSVDGEPVTSWQAVPWRDDQGRVRREPDGKLVPRLATLYDAIVEHYQGDDSITKTGSATEVPVSVLCHQEHLKPVAVCRVCLVLVSRKGVAEGRLVPACKFPIQAGLEIHTRASREPA